MLAGIGGALVDGLADVDPVVQELVDAALVELLAVFVDEALGGQFSGDGGRGAAPGELLEDAADDGRLGSR